MNKLLSFFILQASFFGILQVSSCNKEDGLPSRYSISESIRVQLPKYEEIILSCILEVRLLPNPPSSHLLTFTLYDTALSFYLNSSMLKYVGKDDNTCSFEIIPDKWPKYLLYNSDNPFTKEWIVYEQHVDDGSWYKNLKSWLGASEPDRREYSFYLSPQTFSERLTMAMSGHHITRHAPYNNETITIITPPKKNIIHQCTLIIGGISLLQESREIVLYSLTPSSLSYASADSGFEFIGADDNSCSFKIFIDTLERRGGNYFNVYWKILEENSNGEELGHTFRMKSTSWWLDNKKSNLYLYKGVLQDTIEEYF